jgi:hypothetical protein
VRLEDTKKRTSFLSKLDNSKMFGDIFEIGKVEIGDNLRENSCVYGDHCKKF